MSTIRELREMMAKAKLPLETSCDDFGNPHIRGDWVEYKLAVAAANHFAALLDVAEAAETLCVFCPDEDGPRWQKLGEALKRLEEIK